jgi:hypothetical protein
MELTASRPNIGRTMGTLISATRDRRCQHAPDHESLVLDAVSDQ